MYPWISTFKGDIFHAKEILLLSVYLLLYTKRPSRSHDFNATIDLKKEPSWAEIVTKMCFNTACQTKPTANTVFSLNYLCQGWIVFKPDFFFVETMCLGLLF